MIHTPLPAGTEVSWTVPTLHGAKTYSGCVLAFIPARADFLAALRVARVAAVCALPVIGNPVNAAYLDRYLVACADGLRTVSARRLEQGR